MFQVCIHGAGDVRVDTIDAPRPGHRDVVVSVAACGICGSDLSYIALGGTGATMPMPLGHEIAGTVEWVGGDVASTAVGDRVIVHPGELENPTGIIGNGGSEGGLTPSLLVREAAQGQRLYPVPDGLSLEIAALAEPVAVGMQAANQTDAVAGESVAVFGCGPIGLAAIATLVDRGVEAIGVDLSPTRLKLASRLGARAVLDPRHDDVWEALADLHGTAPFAFGPTPATNAYIEATGSSQVLMDIVERGRVGGRLSVVALHYKPVATNYLLLLMKAFQIRGSFAYPERFEDAVELLARRDLSSMITHRIPLERFDEALAILNNDKNCGKVLVTMGADS